MARKFDLPRGVFVRCTSELEVGNDVFHEPLPKGAIGVVVLTSRDQHGDFGPLVRWQNGWTCNVYRGWVETLEGSVSEYLETQD